MSGSRRRKASQWPWKTMSSLSWTRRSHRNWPKKELARELVSKVQQMRKQNDYEMMDKIAHLSVCAMMTLRKQWKIHREYIMKETLAESIENKEGLEEVDLNGHKTGLAVERI